MNKGLIWVLLAFALGLYLSVDSWPQTIVTGVFVGIDLDKVGTSGLTPDGQLDNHIKISGVKTTVISKVTITDDALGLWEHPFNGKNWEIDVEQTGTVLDLWFAQFHTTQFFNVTITYSDNSVDKINVPTSGGGTISGLVGQVAATGNQTLCTSGYINPDSTVTASYWADVLPCATLVNSSVLKTILPVGVTMCSQRNAGVFDLWASKVMPCVHP